jgi:hypothetical protein
MENDSYLVNISVKMKAASSSCNHLISMSNSLWRSNFLRCHSRKMISIGTNVRQIVDHFVGLTDINKMGSIFFRILCFLVEALEHCPHYVELHSLFAIGSSRVLSGI